MRTSRNEEEEEKRKLAQHDINVYASHRIKNSNFFSRKSIKVVVYVKLNKNQ
jgi:hypothetical protein